MFGRSTTKGRAVARAAAVAIGVGALWGGPVAPAGRAPAATTQAAPQSEVTQPAADPARDTYLSALDDLSDEQAEMVPVVLAALGEIECDGLAVDQSKASAFIAAHAADASAKARSDEAAIAKSTSQALMKPWLDYVQEDPTQFCQQAYALKDTGRDLWRH